MPLTLSTVISGCANRFHSPTTSTNQQKLYFPPGGHTHDRHAIPPDRLHISFSDPVLVAAEQSLSGVPNRLVITKDAGARKTAKPRPFVFHFKKGEILSQRPGDDNDSPLVPELVSPLVTVLNTSGTSQGHFWKAEFQKAATQLLDSSDEPCGISEVVTFFSATDGPPGNANSSASENRYTLTNKLWLPLPDR